MKTPKFCSNNLQYCGIENVSPFLFLSFIVLKTDKEVAQVPILLMSFFHRN